MFKVAAAGFQHETNRFSPIPTTLADFEREDGWPGLTSGSDLFRVFPGMNIPLGGFLKYSDNQFEIAPVLWTSAEPGGLIEDDAFDELVRRILDQIESLMPLDGIYLDLHGAAVTESYEDAEGELLRRLRSRVGFEIPVAVSLDLHANISLQMVEAADVLTIYRTYPHLDMAKTGFRAGHLLNEILSSGQKPERKFRQLPMLIPLQSQCTDLDPSRSLYKTVDDANSLHAVHAEIAMGFPPADIWDNGPAIVAYSYSESAASQGADKVEQVFLGSESRFPVPLYSADEAVRLALENSRSDRPVLLADIQDNSGAGSTSDTTGLLRALANHRVQNCAMAALFDEQAVEMAYQAGVGSEFSCDLGGKFGGDDNPAFHGRFRVAALSDGEFKYRGEMMRGVTAHIGATAALELIHRHAHITIVVTSSRIQCVDQAVFSHIGIEPSEKAILAVKSTVHFRADFEPIADRIILVESPGFNPCRLTSELLPRLRPGVRLL